MRTRKIALLTTATLVVSGVAIPSYAQEVASPSNDRASSDDPAFNVEEGSEFLPNTIVVTAQKRAEDLQDVPIVISTVSSEQLERSNVETLPQVAVLVPGLNPRHNTGAFQPVLRGIGTSSIVVENPVALYIDGVYLPQQREGLRELPDVEQIAVLKGPQGTLFGRNATAGVIQITTRRPSQELAFQGKVELDNYETFRGSAYVSGGLGSGAAASVSMQYASQGDGYGTNLVTGNDTYKLLHSLMARAKIVVEPSSRTEITIIADYMDRAARNQTIQPYPGTAFTLPQANPLRSRYDTNSLIDATTTYEGGGMSLTVDQDVGFGDLRSITAYRKGKATFIFDAAPTGVPTLDVVAPKDPNSSFQQELTINSISGSTFTWTVGAFYLHSVNETSPITRALRPGLYGPAGPLPNSTAQASTFGKEVTDSVAPFGQVGVDITDRTTLTLGARYTYEKRDFDAHVVVLLYNGTVIRPPAVAAEQSIKKPTWRIALDHEFSEDVMVYASYNRGIKSGGFNIGNATAPAYLPEKLDAYEAGVKTELADGRLRLNIGGFYYDYTNIQVVQFVNATQLVTNGAQARLYGVDLDFDAQLTEELSVTGGMEILHAKFSEYRNALGSIPKLTGGATLVTIDATGNRLPGSQEFVGTLAVNYSKKLDLGELALNVAGAYNGDYFFETDNFARQDEYLMLNASLTWTSPDERFSASLWAKNLLDETVASNVATLNLGYLALYDPPRTVGVSFGVNF